MISAIFHKFHKLNIMRALDYYSYPIHILFETPVVTIRSSILKFGQHAYIL